MAKKKDYEALEVIAENALMQFNPEITVCDYMSHGKRFRIVTPKAGEVFFMLDRDCLENKRKEPASISIFARFENEKAAKALGFDSNPFSGKWNHHFVFNELEINRIFSELKERAF